MNHPSPQELAAYSRGEMNPDELLYVGDHLAVCPACSASTAEIAQPPTLRQWRQVLCSPLDAGHLEDEQLIAFMRDQCPATERASLAAHLASCPLCTADLEDLRAFHAQMAPSAGRVFEPAASPGLLAGLDLRQWFQAETLRRWLAPVAAAGLAAGGLYWMGLRPLQTQLNSTSGQLAAVRSERDSALRKQTELERRLADASPAADPRRPALELELKAIRGREAALRERLARLETQASEKNLPGETVAAGPKPDAQIAKVLASGRLDLPEDLAHLRGKAGRLLGGDTASAFGVKAPYGSVVLRTRPTFRWRPLPNATAYRVLVFDEAFNMVAEAMVRGDVEWKPEKPLARGKTYRWEVVALRGDEELERTPRPPMPAAQFRVLDAATAAKLGQAGAAGPLERGIRYAAAGLVQEAERELEAALETGATAKDREQAQKLLQQIRDLQATDSE